jgi:hypothetical protein
MQFLCELNLEIKSDDGVELFWLWVEVSGYRPGSKSGL